MKFLWHNFLHSSVTIMLLGHNTLKNALIQWDVKFHTDTKQQILFRRE